MEKKKGNKKEKSTKKDTTHKKSIKPIKKLTRDSIKDPIHKDPIKSDSLKNDLLKDDFFKNDIKYIKKMDDDINRKPRDKGFFKAQFIAFIESFKYNINILYILLFEFLFYVILLFVNLYYLPKVFLPKFSIFYNQLAQIASVPANFPTESVNAIDSLQNYVIVSFIGMVLIFAIGYVVLKGLIWMILISRDFDRSMIKQFFRSYFLKYLGLMMLVDFVYILLFYIFYDLVKPELFPLVLIVLTLIFIHIGVVIQPVFVANPKFLRAISGTMNLIFKRFYIFIIPYIIIILLTGVLFLINLLIATVFGFLGNYLSFMVRVGYLVALILFTLFITWAKNYLWQNIRMYLE